MNGNGNGGISTRELATLLGGAFLLNYGILFLWFIVYMAAPDWLYEINSRWFPISRHEFDLVNYCGIGFLKLVSIAFFFSPYLAIKVWLRRNRTS